MYCTPSYRPCSWILSALLLPAHIPWYTHHRIHYLVLEYWKNWSYLHFYIFASITFPQYQVTNYSMAWSSFKFIPLIKVNKRSPESHVQMELVGDFVRIFVGKGRVAMKQFPIRSKLFTHNHVVPSSVLCSNEDPQGFPISRGSLLSVSSTKVSYTHGEAIFDACFYFNSAKNLIIAQIYPTSWYFSVRLCTYRDPFLRWSLFLL